MDIPFNTASMNSVIRTLFCLLLAALSMSSSVAHAGISDGLVEWLAEDAVFTTVRQVEFHPVVDNTGNHFDFDAAEAATQTLRQKLSQAGMVLADPGGSAQHRIVIKSSLVYYQPGSVGGRWIGFGGGSAVCILRTLLIRCIPGPGRRSIQHRRGSEGTNCSGRTTRRPHTGTNRNGGGRR
jgi:hypothetical protein